MTIFNFLTFFAQSSPKSLSVTAIFILFCLGEAILKEFNILIYVPTKTYVISNSLGEMDCTRISTSGEIIYNGESESILEHDISIPVLMYASTKFYQIFRTIDKLWHKQEFGLEPHLENSHSEDCPLCTRHTYWSLFMLLPNIIKIFQNH